MLWTYFRIVAILDGYSRKLLALSVFKEHPNTQDLLKLIGATIQSHGKPRFIVSDHGGQFKERYQAAITACGITPIQGRPRHPEFNGKVERLFKTFKLWQRVALLFASTESLHRALENFRNWYNSERCHQAIGGLTPNEVWSGTARPEPIRYLTRDQVQPVFRLHRSNFRGDSRLPVFNIQTLRPLKKSA